MKKAKIITMALVVAMTLSSHMAVSAAGPFFDGNVDEFVSGEEIAPDGAGLKAAIDATGQELAPNREFVEGNPSSWSEENEGAHKLVDGFPSTKYGSSTNENPYMATWKYSEAFVAGHIILCTANDSFENPRRMDDGWTLKGSNDGSSWNVVYTGKGEDVDNENYGWFTIAIPNNTTAYSYYRIESEFGYDSDGVQYAEVELTKVPGAAPAEAAAPVEAEVPAAPAEEAAPAPAAETPAPAPAQTSTPAPRTADPITLVAAGSLISAIGAFIVKKRKS